MKKVILFDYDGTILDSMGLVYSSYNGIAGKYGMKKIESLKEFIKLYDKNIYESFFELGLDKKRVGEFIKDFRKPLIEADSDLKVFDGMRKIVEKVSKKYKVIIITSNMTEVVEHSLKNHKIKMVREVVGGDKEISKIKKIKKILERFPGCEIYYVGDTKGDMIEAKKMGVKAIAVSWGHHSRKKLEEAGADFIVDKPEELLEILI